MKIMIILIIMIDELKDLKFRTILADTEWNDDTTYVQEWLFYSEWREYHIQYIKNQNREDRIAKNDFDRIVQNKLICVFRLKSVAKTLFSPPVTFIFHHLSGLIVKFVRVDVTRFTFDHSMMAGCNFEITIIVL